MYSKRKCVGVVTLTTIIFGFVTSIAIPAFAQTDDYGTTTGTYCPQLSQTVFRGSIGNQVLELQKFLSDYYDIPPTTIQTGYFGRITQSYVIRFQQEQGLPSYGIAGSMTRAAIARVCGDVVRNDNTNTLTVTPTTGSAPLKVTASFFGSSGCPEYSISWGDGQSYSTPPREPFTSCTAVMSSVNLTHTYLSPGSYTIKLTLSNRVFSKTVTVTAQPSSNRGVNFSASPTQGSAPLAVSFSARSESNMPVSVYYIDFGDGSSAGMQGISGTCEVGTGGPCNGGNNMLASHTYSKAGTFTATLNKRNYCDPNLEISCNPISPEKVSSVKIVVTQAQN